MREEINFPGLGHTEKILHLSKHEAEVDSVHLVVSAGIGHLAQVDHHQLQGGEHHRRPDLGQNRLCRKADECQNQLYTYDQSEIGPVAFVRLLCHFRLALLLLRF